MFEFAEFLPSTLTTIEAGSLVAASLVTSFISAAFGIGGGIFLIALMALFIPPAALIPVHGIIQLGSNGGRAALMTRHVVWRPMIPFVLGTLLGAGMGAMIAVQIPAWVVQLALGIFIIVAVFAKLPLIKQKYIFLGGIISSFLTMLFGATGNFIAAMVKSMNLQPLRHVATHSVMMSFQHFTKVVMFGFVGFQFGAYIPLITAMLISGFVGTIIGKHFLTRAGGHYFKPVLNAILLLAAARLIWAGIDGLLAI